MKNPNHLKSRTPETWAQEIEQLPEAIQPTIGSAIWWDYFSDGRRPSGGLFEKWLAPFRGRKDDDDSEPCKLELRDGLVALGYTHSEAAQRFMYHKYYDPNLKARMMKGDAA